MKEGKVPLNYPVPVLLYHSRTDFGEAKFDEKFSTTNYGTSIAVEPKGTKRKLDKTQSRSTSELNRKRVLEFPRPSSKTFRS